MNVIFTCGGTGGHINPAISVANLLRERMPDSKILFIGAEDGMEKNLVPRAGYELETIRISNFQRKLTPAGVWHNVTTACHMAGSMQKAKKIIRAFQPDVIVGTGGYASYPALHMGAKLGIPTAVHESNAVPGLTTRMVAGHVSRIMVSLADSSNQYPDPEKVTVTGTPVGSAFLYGDREKSRAALGIGDEPLIVSAWAAWAPGNEQEDRPFYGAGGPGRPLSPRPRHRLLRLALDAGLRPGPGAPVGEPPLAGYAGVHLQYAGALAAADLMLCRAGAGTISEVCASGTPCIMIPSPNVTDNHQEKNARVLEKRGAAVVVREKDCDGDSLYETARALLSDPDRLREMRLAARRLAVVDAAEQILQVIRDLAAGKA